MTEVVPSELELARMIAAGTMPSPSFHCGNAFFSLRLSGVGVAFRPSRNEFVYRPPEIWLGDEMQQRVLGLPAIVQHPPGQQLNGDELAKRVIGTIIHSYIEGDSLMGVARVIDESAAQALAKFGADTSPAVVFRNGGDNITLDVGDGDVMLVEAEPSLVDHIAVLPGPEGRGVWGKGRGEDAGVELTNTTPTREDATCPTT
jgi:hypothetical protein